MTAIFGFLCWIIISLMVFMCYNVTIVLINFLKDEALKNKRKKEDNEHY